MSTKIRQIIDIIISECPESSSSDIENAIIEFIESNLPEIISNVELPEKSPPSFTHNVKGFRQTIQKRKLDMDSSRYKLISDLENIQDHLKEKHKYDSADTITQDITNLDKSSSTYRANLIEIDTHIARIEHEMDGECTENDAAIKKLGDLTNDST